MLIRDVPEELQRAMKVEAAKRGISLRALIIELMEKHIEEIAKREARK
jgi:predicted HicB family RNase H-like nuclease